MSVQLWFRYFAGFLKFHIHSLIRIKIIFIKSNTFQFIWDSNYESCVIMWSHLLKKNTLNIHATHDFINLWFQMLSHRLISHIASCVSFTNTTRFSPTTSLFISSEKELSTKVNLSLFMVWYKIENQSLYLSLLPPHPTRGTTQNVSPYIYI